VIHLKSKPLPHFDARLTGTVVDALVIHSMFSPGAGDEFSPENCINLLDKHKVAAHYILSRRGQIWKLVDENNRAWHAGDSKLPFADDSRQGVNAFSIGVELIGSDKSGFTKSQYSKLAKLTKDILTRHPIRIIVGHEHIAPTRKQDPGPNFNWPLFKKCLGALGLNESKFRFVQ
jgi:AmpD protein